MELIELELTTSCSSRLYIESEKSATRKEIHRYIVVFEGHPESKIELLQGASSYFADQTGSF